MNSSWKMTSRLRRMRRVAVPALAVALCGATAAPGHAVASDAVAADATAAPEVSTLGVGVVPVTTAPGADGAMWALDRPDGGYVVRRVGADGTIMTVAPIGAPYLRNGLTALPDGGMAVVTADAADLSDSSELTLTELPAGAGPVRHVRLPASAQHVAAFAIGADRTVWWANACENRLWRRAPGGRVSSFSLGRPRTCARWDDGGALRFRRELVEEGSALALAADGSVWFANGCQRRVVRVDVHGRVLQRPLPRQVCDGAYGGGTAPARIVPGPAGGAIVSLGNLSTPDRTAWVSPGGRVKEVSADLSAGFVFTGPETVWTARGQLTWSGRAGGLDVPEGNGVAAVARARDGKLWTVGGTAVQRMDDKLGPYTVFVDPWVGQADGRGPRLDRWSLGQPGDVADPLQLAPDGSFWLRKPGGFTRVLPAGVTAPRQARAAVSALLATEPSAVTLQLSCAADRARFCRGTVKLGGAAAPVPFVAPGAERVAVRLPLTDRAARRLKLRGRLKTTAYVRSLGGGVARRALTLRRGGAPGGR